MATFKELLEQLKNPPETGLPADFTDQLSNAYDEGISQYTESAAAALEAVERERTMREAADAAKLAAQEHNARLLRSLPAGDDGPNNTASNDDGDSNTDPFESSVTIDSLITYE